MIASCLGSISPVVWYNPHGLIVQLLTRAVLFLLPLVIGFFSILLSTQSPFLPEERSEEVSCRRATRWLSSSRRVFLLHQVSGGSYGRPEEAGRRDRRTGIEYELQGERRWCAFGPSRSYPTWRLWGCQCSHQWLHNGMVLVRRVYERSRMVFCLRIVCLEGVICSGFVSKLRSGRMFRPGLCRLLGRWVVPISGKSRGVRSRPQRVSV